MKTIYKIIRQSVCNCLAMCKCKSGNESCGESDSVNDERDDADHEAGHKRKEGGRPEEQERHGHESGSDGGDRARVEVLESVFKDTL